MMNLVKTPKGVIAVLLVLCLVFCPLANLPAIAETQEEIVYWDGTKYSDLATTQASMEGEGTEASPYIVTTPKQLYSLIYYQGGGAYYQLANDIYINEGYENYLNWDATTKPARDWTSGTGRANFSGTLDGAGYTVYGLYNHETAATSFSGLIPGLSYSSATSAVIKNLNVKNSYVAGKRFVGVICGGPYTKNGTLSISNCTVSECKVNAITDNACAGSIVGIARNTTVNNCAATDVTFITGGNNTVRSGYAGMGAIIGSSYISTGTGAWKQSQANSTKITNSYSVNVKLVLSEEDERLLYPTGIFSDSAAASYCISAKNVYTDATTIPSHVTIPAISVLVSSTDDTSAAIDPTSENYPIKTITAESIKGNLALDTMPGLAWGSEWVSVLEDYPIPEGGNIPGYWDGWQGDEYDSLSAVQASMEGSGTKDDPYIITDADQLYAAIYYGGGSFSSIGAVGTCYELANDLYLNVGYKNYAEWDTTTPVNKWMSNSGSTDFNGTIDGAGHTIYGYYNSGAYTGLIPYIDAGTSTDVTLYVKNLNMAYSAVVNANWRTLSCLPELRAEAEAAIR